ncbi:MAG: hypothetical protein NC310_01205 [Roseburia sp.]|nr:hypothetical protein [Anaeroplasma bactoclasticum]MCM1195671.1 hypothetical protein [Roseburia sp.]MCM1556128.1 hypothetical protein [Anaeroplasma bactoclasticum]
MNEIELEKYFIKHKEVSIPELQKKFHLSYKEIHSIILKFLDEKIIFLKDALNYAYIEHTEKLPLIYKQVLWDCIKNNYVSSSYMQRKFSLSVFEARDIINWMRENEFIGQLPFPEVQMTKHQFIERFGTITEDIEEKKIEVDIDSFCDTKPDETKSMKELLNSHREDLKKRMQECENKLNQESVDEIKNSEEDDLDIIKYCDPLEILNEPETSFEKRYYDVIEKILLVDKEILQQAFLSIVKKILEFPFVSGTALESVYEKVYQNISQLTEKEFQGIKDIILDKKGE